MNASTEIWPAFFKTSGMLAFVIALLVLVFYLIKRFSAARGVKGSDEFIKVLAVHYFSPKEKLVLLDVLGDKIFIGVTPQTITRIAVIDRELNCDRTSNSEDDVSSGFSTFLAKAVHFNSLRKKHKEFSSLSDSKFERKSEPECKDTYDGGGNGK